MATLHKKGGKKNGKWYIVVSYRDETGRPQKKWIGTGVGDKEAADKLLTQYRRNKDRGVAGLIDPRQPALDRPAGDWLAAYLYDLRGRCSPEHADEVERVLRHALTFTGVGPVRDLTASKMGGYLSALTCSPATKNKHRVYLSGFASYLTSPDDTAKPFPTNPVTKQSVPRTKQTAKPPAKRPLSVAEMGRLLDAAERYPTVAVSVNTGGRPRKDGSPARPRRPVTLSEDTAKRLTLRGRERRLLYRLALLTGLRRGELERLTVRDVYLTGRPRIVASLTKAKRTDTIPLTPGLAEALSGWIKDTDRQPTDRLLTVPSKSNLNKIHQANTALADIPYRDGNGRAASFHALRATLNAYLKRAGVPLTSRRRAMRHVAPDITTKHYDDDTGKMTMGRRVFKLVCELDRLTGRPPVTIPTAAPDQPAAV
ncbi:MAG: site-specific integrase [Gemmataceae bacterium]|nr:site-specific integrase [Gemmataceae bacterium]